MSDQDRCRHPTCNKPSREKGELQYPDDPGKRASNGERYRVDSYGARFCSDYCELRYDHVKAEAREAMIDDMESEDAY